MDEMMIKTMRAAGDRNAPCKWRVRVRTLIRQKPVIGRQMGYANQGDVFYSNWIQFGWVSIDSKRWVQSAHVDEVFDEVVTPPGEIISGLYFVYGDADSGLPAKYKKQRPTGQGVPQTVRFYHTGGGNIKFTKELQEWHYELNRGIEPRLFSKIFDTYNRKGEKFSEWRTNYITGEVGDELPKLPFELSFRRNVIRARNILKWSGGLGIRRGAMVIECDALNPYNLPDPDSILHMPHYIHHCNTITPSGITNPYIYRGGRETGLPCYVGFFAPPDRPLYIELEQCKAVEFAPNPYNPEMEIHSP